MPGAVVTRAPGLQLGTLRIAKAAAGGTAAVQLCVSDLCAGLPDAVASRAAASVSASWSDESDLHGGLGSPTPDVVVGRTAATAHEDDDVCERESPCSLLAEGVVSTPSNEACTDVGSTDLFDVAGVSVAAVSSAMTGPDVDPPGTSTAAANLGLAVVGGVKCEPRDEARVGCKLRSDLVCVGVWADGAGTGLSSSGAVDGVAEVMAIFVGAVACNGNTNTVSGSVTVGRHQVRPRNKEHKLWDSCWKKCD